MNLTDDPGWMDSAGEDDRSLEQGASLRKAARLCGGDVDRAFEAELLLDALDTPAAQTQPERHDDQHAEDQEQRDERRRRPEGVEIGSDR